MLGNLHVVPAVPALTKLLRASNKGVREAAVESLGKFGEHAAPAVPALIKCLADSENRWVRIATANMLGNLGEHAAPAVSALEKSLEDSDDPVRTSAALALENLGKVATSAAASLTKYRKKDFQDFLKFLNCREDNKRKEAFAAEADAYKAAADKAVVEKASAVPELTQRLGSEGEAKKTCGRKGTKPRRVGRFDGREVVSVEMETTAPRGMNVIDEPFSSLATRVPPKVKFGSFSSGNSRTAETELHGCGAQTELRNNFDSAKAVVDAEKAEAVPVLTEFLGDRNELGKGKLG